MERRPQRRLLGGQPPAAVPARHHRPGVPLTGGQRRGAGPEPQFAPVVDEAPDRAAASATRHSASAHSKCSSPRTGRCSRSSASTKMSASSASSICRATSSARSSTFRRCAAPYRSSSRERRTSHPLVSSLTSSRSDPTGSTGSLSSASRRSRRGNGRGSRRHSRWDAVFEGPNRQRLESWLPSYLTERRWFTQKTSTITSAAMVDTVPVQGASNQRGASDGSPVAHLLHRADRARPRSTGALPRSGGLPPGHRGGGHAQVPPGRGGGRSAGRRDGRRPRRRGAIATRSSPP